MKLFDIKADEKKYTIEVATYKNNKVFNKNLQLLKQDGIFKIKENRLAGEDEKAYEITGVLAGTREEFVELFKNEIISYLPDYFPINYSFDFKGVSLGFTLSFIIYRMDEKNTFIKVSHRIKEVRRDGSSKPPKQVIIK